MLRNNKFEITYDESKKCMLNFCLTHINILFLDCNYEDKYRNREDVSLMSGGEKQYIKK